MADIPVLSGVMDALNWWGDNVVEDKILGHGLRLARRAHVLGRDVGAPGGAADAADAAGLTGKAWVDRAFRDAPFQRFVTTAVADPLNLVGLGLFGKGAKVVGEASKLGQGLKFLDAAEKLPGQGVGKVADKLGPLGKQAFDNLYHSTGLGSGEKVLDPNTGRTLQTAAGRELRESAPGNEVRGLQKLVEDHSGAADKWIRGTQMWRSQALWSPGYHLQNMVGNYDQAFRYALETGDWQLLRDMTSGVLKGRTRGDDLLDTFKWVPPQAVNTAGQAVKAGAFKTNPQSFHFRWNQNLGRLGLDPVGSTLGQHSSVFNEVRSGTKVGDVALDAAGKVDRLNRKIGSRVEAPARTAAFGRVFERELQSEAQDFAQQLIAQRPGARQVAEELVKRGGRMDPVELARMLRTKKLGNQDIQTFTRAWEDRVVAAQGKGVDHANGIFFDYSRNEPIDAIGKNALAFHRFAVNNIPTSLRQSFDRPAITNVPRAYYDASDEYNQQHGLTSRYHGEMPIGELGGQQLFLNPVKYLPWGQVVGAATKDDLTQRRMAADPSYRPEDEGSTGVGDALDALKNIGLGLHPLLDAGAFVSGQYGRSLAPGFLRWSQPINGLLSGTLNRPVDIEAPVKGLLGMGLQAATGQTPFPYTDYLLRKRAAELKAFGQDPAQAPADVANTTGLENLVNFAGVLPGFKTLSPEEALIRQNAAISHEARAAGNTYLARMNPTAGVYRNLDPLDEQVANFDRLSPEEAQSLLRNPIARDQLITELSRKLHSSSSKSTKRQPQQTSFLERTLAQLGGH